MNRFFRELAVLCGAGFGIAGALLELASRKCWEMADEMDAAVKRIDRTAHHFE